MTAALTALALKLWPYFVAALAGLALLLQQRRAGAKAERAKQAEREAKARDIAEKVERDVGAMTPEQVKAELKRWSKS